VTLFSVVMPTRNRGHLLRYALQSALEQTFEDYEIVVIDNCSSDETPQVVENLAGDKVRYFRTDRALAMPDNWEFALNKARGEYITYLCDDDAFNPNVLAEVAGIIEQRGSHVLSWTHATYFSETHPVARWRNQLAIPACTGQIEEVDNGYALRELFALRGDPAKLPRMLNSCCHRSVIEKVRSQMGRFFLPPNPDTTCCAEVLAASRSHTYIDKALLIWGAHGESTGVSSAHSRGAATQTFVKEFGQDHVFECAPIGALTITNSIAESLLRVKRAMPELFAGCDIDWVKYFTDCYFELTSLSVDASAIAAERRELKLALTQRPVGFRARVWMAYLRRASLRGAFRWGGALGRSVPLVRHFGRALQQGKTGTRIIRGEDWGFQSILDCRRFLSMSKRTFIYSSTSGSGGIRRHSSA